MKRNNFNFTENYHDKLPNTKKTFTKKNRISYKRELNNYLQTNIK